MRYLKYVVSTLLAVAAVPWATRPVLAGPAWTSPDRYRVLVTVNPRGVTRKNSPAVVRVDLPASLTAMGGSGTVDESTIEVVGYNASGAPRAFDATRPGYEQYLLPWRTQRYYGVGYVDLSFVMPDQTCTQYALYFDTVQSGLGKPLRYPGLVGDGDFFREDYKRREINACHMDCFADFDGDGDLDLFKGGVEPFVYCWENVGGNRYVERGRLTSDGQPFELPAYSNHRSWLVVHFVDWDHDGDQDFFASFTNGPDIGHIRRYKNVAVPGGRPSFQDLGYLLTQSGQPMGNSWFSTMTVVDWDNDGKQDILSTRDNCLAFHRNLGPDNDMGNIVLADGVYVLANGKPIKMDAPRFSCADLDADGDLDMMCGSQNGEVYWFTNVGTRSNPVFTAGRLIAMYEFMDCYSYPTIADFDGDGLLDFVVGRFWERTHFPEQGRMYGRMYKNVGTATSPRWQARDASNGAPYTEGFQMCDAVRQNGVRAVDWNNDGRTDLIASDTDGFIWYFQNLTNRLFPLFAPGVKINAAGTPIRMLAEGNWGGYARCDVTDWNSDGKKDLLVADGRAWLWLFVNTGNDASPEFGAGQRIYCGSSPIDCGDRGSVLVADWDNDGKKDVLFGDEGGYYWYENTGTDSSPAFTTKRNITFNGQTVTYNRPNMGSYLDWDGDGKKDFIGAEFENSIRLYTNTGMGGTNVVPQFADKEGQAIVVPYSIMTCSGADAKDFNGDGDVDIATGQGHGGSGLRFYERDYINDYTTGLFPIVTLGGVEQGRTIVAAKSLANGSSVLLPKLTVSACFSGFFYAQSSDRLSAIRVQLANHGRVEGEIVDVQGVIQTNSAGERYIAASSVIPNP